MAPIDKEIKRMMRTPIGRWIYLPFFIATVVIVAVGLMATLLQLDERLPQWAYTVPAVPFVLLYYWRQGRKEWNLHFDVKSTSAKSGIAVGSQRNSGRAIAPIVQGPAIFHINDPSNSEASQRRRRHEDSILERATAQVAVPLYKLADEPLDAFMMRAYSAGIVNNQNLRYDLVSQNPDLRRLYAHDPNIPAMLDWAKTAQDNVARKVEAAEQEFIDHMFAQTRFESVEPVAELRDSQFFGRTVFNRLVRHEVQARQPAARFGHATTGRLPFRHAGNDLSLGEGLVARGAVTIFEKEVQEMAPGFLRNTVDSLAGALREYQSELRAVADVVDGYRGRTMLPGVCRDCPTR